MVKKLTHLDKTGRAQMVNVGHKPMTNRQAIAEGLEGLMAAFPDARWSVRRRIVAGSQAAVHYVLTGTLATSLGAYEARGQRLTLEGVHLFTFGPEGIVDTRDFWDGSAFHRQMSRDHGG